LILSAPYNSETKIDSAHIRQIESKVKAERGEVSALDSKLTEKGAPYSKWKLRQAMSRLNEVETFLLPQALKAQTEYYAAKWLETAEYEIAAAAQTRQNVQKDSDKFGSDTVEVGD
jgi:hypothetical protein